MKKDNSCHWRPPGWKRKEITNNPLHCFAPQQCADSFFEAGADAILEGLKHQPDVLYVDELCEGSVIRHDPRRIGWLVFIPDEKEV